MSPSEVHPATPSWKEWVTYGVAILSLLGFAWFINYLLGMTKDASEMEWTRAVYLLSGVEAIVFAAAGFLFGREVHRQRAETAEARATTAEEQSAVNQEKAVTSEAKTKALVTYINTKFDSMKTKSPQFEAFGAGPTVSLTIADFEELRDFAQKLTAE